MTQQTHASEDADTPTTDSTNAVPPELQALIDAIQKDPAKTAEEIKTLRAEAKRRRLDAEAADRDRLKAEAARLEADQKWQEAAQTYKQRVDDLTPKAARLAEMEQILKDSAQKRIEALPKQWRGLVPEYDDPAKTLAWLDTNAATLALPAVPNLDAGAQGDHATPTKLPDGLEDMAAKFGVKKERVQQELAKRK